MKSAKIYIILLLAAISLSCGKEWLEVKRDRALVVPQSLRDLRMLLTNESDINKDYVALSELSCDDYYSPAAFFSSASATERTAYIWDKDIDIHWLGFGEWDAPYKQILVANVVLDEITKIERTNANQADWDDVKGAALFLRGRVLFNLAQTFSPVYDEATAATDKGVALKLTSNVRAKTTRASVKETYDQIIADITAATALLRPSSEFVLDPTKPAAYGLLARCYLSMRNYGKAFEYADKCLQLHSALLDFNTITNTTIRFPIPRFNQEVIYHSEIGSVYGFFIYREVRAPDSFYNMYENDDLRKTVLFTDLGDGEHGTHSYRGSYAARHAFFTGLTSAEMYLIRAECYARNGNTNAALDDLNTLLESRYRTGTFVPRTAVDATAALELVFQERRKDLQKRGLRWSDIRRFSKEPEHAITLSRTVEGITYTIAPGSPRYTMPIPNSIIVLTGIEQNQR